MIKMQRGLLPSENHTAADRRESTGSKGSKDRSPPPSAWQSCVCVRLHARCACRCGPLEGYTDVL